MADDDKKDAGPTPAIDADAIQTAVSNALKDWQPPQPQVSNVVPSPEPTVNNRNPLEDVVGPVVKPMIYGAQVEAADAKDAALFYASDEAKNLSGEEKRAIEQAFEQLKKQGTPFSRAAVFAWHRGTGKNFDKAVEQAIKDRDTKIKAAEQQTSVGPGSPDRGGKPAVDAHSLSDDDLTKAMQGQAF